MNCKKEKFSMKENFILDMKKVKIPVNSTLDKYAKENRKNMTDEEKKGLVSDFKRTRA